MNRLQTWGVGGLVAAIMVALVIVPNSISTSADPVVTRPVSAVSNGAATAADPMATRPLSAVSNAAATAADSEDPESVEAPPPAVVGFATAAFGRKLVDRSGQTLYVFALDPPGKSSCVGACARTWLPARSLGGKPQPGADVGAPSVGNIQRADGSEQITFNGHPVYYYSGDASPGQSNGNGRSEFGGMWSAQPPPWAGGPR